MLSDGLSYACFSDFFTKESVNERAFTHPSTPHEQNIHLALFNAFEIFEVFMKFIRI